MDVFIIIQNLIADVPVVAGYPLGLDDSKINKGKQGKPRNF